MTDFERRKVLKAGGAALTFGLAGCVGPFKDRQGVPGTVEPAGNESENGDGGGGGVQATVDEHLSQTTNYDGTIEDHTGEDTVQVTNGEVEGTEQQFVFDPPAIQVDPGTTVVWEWTGTSSHSVTDSEEAFDSGIQSGEGTTFEFTFDEAGVYLYYCQPHRALNQKGAIVVGDPDTGGGGGGGGGGGASGEVDEFLSDANNYDGSIEDMTGEDSVSVVNGANSPDYAFDPAAIRISTGTEVTWEWAEDVSHSVTHDNGDAFDSGIQGGADTTFSHTFEEAGTYLYVCTPHRALGQLGAVVVEE